MTSTILRNPCAAPIHGKISYSQPTANRLGVCLVNHDKTKRDITYEYTTNSGTANLLETLHPDRKCGGVG